MPLRAPEKSRYQSSLGRHLASSIKHNKVTGGERESSMMIQKLRYVRSDVRDNPERFATEKRKILKLAKLANKKGLLSDILLREVEISLNCAERKVARLAKEEKK